MKQNRPVKGEGRELEKPRETDLRLEDFDYFLPEERIARIPHEARSGARLLVTDRASGVMRDQRVLELPMHLKAGDCLVMNDTRVLKARIMGRKRTGGKVEILLHRPLEAQAGLWEALLRPNLRKEGELILFEGIDATACYEGKTPAGLNQIRVKGISVEALMAAAGQIPLPPYLGREAVKEDERRYQTVFARQEGSIAAPTAGLHLDWPLLEQLQSQGVRLCWVTLHVGYGTFQTVRDIPFHQMHRESFVISGETAQVINETKASGGRVWAVGTTVARTLETCVLNGSLLAGSGETDLFILPPFEFEIVDGLLTNFHLPRSTLLMLVSAWMGQDLRKKAYAHAIANGYRFYSYGDAMLVF